MSKPRDLVLVWAVASPMLESRNQKPTVWQQWVDRPEHVWLRNVMFRVHYWIGAALSAYIFLMSASGSLLVYRNELASRFSVEWLVNLHENLLAGSVGRIVNGIGAASLLLLCLTGAVIWWPGIAVWRRSLTVDWSARFPRINWDVHSALGFWSFGFVFVWGLSALYFVFPRPFAMLLVLDPADRFIDVSLYWLSQLHFGRFGGIAQAVWVIVGLVPAILAFTGMFICCRRVIYGKPSNPKQTSS
jgi:uncharacterized iron-regulated membrane protein